MNIISKLVISSSILLSAIASPVLASTIPADATQSTQSIPTYEYYHFTVTAITPDYIIAHPDDSDTLYTFTTDYMRDGDNVKPGDILGVVIDPSHHDSDNDMGLINIEQYRPID